MDKHYSERDWQRIKDILGSALEIDPDLLPTYLDRACSGDTDIRREVESLLASAVESSDFIESPVFSATQLTGKSSAMTGRKFGNFEVIDEIGVGGMGAVYLAKRTGQEFKQQVALKVVRQSISDSQMIERFRRERRILASLNHPNIAKLIDGGVSETGEPYLAMEYVEGETITDFVGRTKPSLNETLRLFIKVCHAVAYAHRNLIVHRDIKPGNILVTIDGEPKLLDFGLARLVDDSIEGDPTQTQTAFRALTPAYASPEQIRGAPITTSSDVYSLGIVLFELLTGERPFHFERKSIDEIIRTITTSKPTLPSRSTPAASFLKGDLDNIILTSLRNEPERRYRSVELFADDIGRHLKGLPVLARPNTLKYRSSKFIGRHKFGVLAASLVFLSLVGGIVVSVYQARRAEREKTKSDVVSTFLQNLLGASNPATEVSRNNGHETTVKELLDAASARLETDELSNQPEVRAQLESIIGMSYLAQGQYDAATRNLDSSLATKTAIYGENSLEVMETMVLIGDLWVTKGNYEEADKFYTQRLSILRSEERKGNIHADYLFSALSNYALLKRAQGDSKAAEEVLREALALSTEVSQEEKNDVSVAESVLALTLADQGKFDDAEQIARKKNAEVRSQSSPETLAFAGNVTFLGSILSEKGEYDTAENLLVEAESSYRKLFSDSYLPLGDNLRIQAQTLYFQNKLPEASIKINETLEIYQKGTSPQYVNYATALMIKGLILNKSRNSRDAEPLLREAVKLRDENLPKGHFLRAVALSSLGEYLTEKDRFAEAEPLLLESFESLRLSQGPSSPRTLLAQKRLFNLYSSWKKPDQAASYEPLQIRVSLQ